jgi:transcriptional regulator with XRE-family HTH domain
MRYLNLEELGALARKVREDAGLSQTETAQRIGSTQSNVSAAEKGESSRYISVALSIIETIGGKRIEGPLYGVTDDEEENHE